MGKRKKQKDRGPQLSLTRAKNVKAEYKSKYYTRGQLRRDGRKFTKHKKCMRRGCNVRLTKFEYDRFGYLCWDHL